MRATNRTPDGAPTSLRRSARVKGAAVVMVRCSVAPRSPPARRLSGMGGRQIPGGRVMTPGQRHTKGAATAIVPSGPRDRRHCEATVRARGAVEPAFERCARRAGELARTGPYTASPGGGPMGIGYPAAAGPVHDQRPADQPRYRRGRLLPPPAAHGRSPGTRVVSSSCHLGTLAPGRSRSGASLHRFLLRLHGDPPFPFPSSGAAAWLAGLAAVISRRHPRTALVPQRTPSVRGRLSPLYGGVAGPIPAKGAPRRAWMS
jgi:hypothetical protein